MRRRDLPCRRRARRESDPWLRVGASAQQWGEKRRFGCKAPDAIGACICEASEVVCGGSVIWRARE